MDLKWLFQKNRAGKTGLGLIFSGVADFIRDDTAGLLKAAKRKLPEFMLCGALVGGSWSYVHSFGHTPVGEDLWLEPEQKSRYVRAYENAPILHDTVAGAFTVPGVIVSMGGLAVLALSAQDARRKYVSAESDLTHDR